MHKGVIPSSPLSPYLLFQNREQRGRLIRVIRGVFIRVIRVIRGCFSFIAADAAPNFPRSLRFFR